MFEIMNREVNSCDLKDVVAKLIPDSIAKEIEKACQSIYPLQNVCIRKVKVIKMPKYDVQKLLELHAESDITSVPLEDTGDKVERAEDRYVEPLPQESV